ncbi:MAG: hypothetical protein ACOC3Y_00495 [Desulfohalobiaceae bacterium]
MAEEKPKRWGRRNFLRSAGASVIGLAAAGSAGFFLNNATDATASQSSQDWAYSKLDPDRAAKRAYEHYFKGG